jgi:hypothetical protein
MSFSISQSRVSRYELDGLMSDFIAKGGQPRQYPRGFTSDWMYLQSIMARFGYELRCDRRWYVLRPLRSRGSPKRITRTEVLAAIDKILVDNGMQPFLRREA